MINSIATYKESLSRIANEVFDGADELDIRQPRDRSRDDSPAPARRLSQRPRRFGSPVASQPVANGVVADPGSNDEVSKYKADIQRLKASEAEIKQLAFSYAAVLKEKEEQLSKLREENGSLRRSMDVKESSPRTSMDGSSKTLSNTSKGSMERSPIRSHRNTSHGNSRSGNHLGRLSITKQDGYSNGSMQPFLPDATTQEVENSPGNVKEHQNLVDDDGSLSALHKSEIKKLKAQLDLEREHASTIKLKLQEECHLKESSQREVQDLKIEKERTVSEMNELQKDLREKISELQQLQAELSRKNMDEDLNESLANLKNTISMLEKENAKLKVEKNGIEADLKQMKNAAEMGANDSASLDKNSTNKMTEKAIEDMELSVLKLKENLEHTSKERDKALQELNRLKQHLLDKELEDSEKMDEDSKIIEELRAAVEYQRSHILQLERALKQESVTKDELKKFKSVELQKSNEIINDLRQKLANCMSMVEAKNIELQNLQTALGQYYAESEAKERLGRDLALSKEESAKLSEQLKIANQGLEISRRENEEVHAKLLQAERMLSEGKRAIHMMEEDNSKLRRALEQNMTRLNRMSMDSDNYVDRRIVIKLLVTYFQRNHSKEVLDLMVRMLGFSEEDKQRIGFAQGAAGKGVVRGVLGLPGRLVGGILGGSAADASPFHASENQSFADLWVDFLLKDAEERERRESEEAARVSSSSKDVSSSTSRSPSMYSIPASNYPNPSRQQQPFDHLDSEFATVPLNSSLSPPPASGTSSRY